MPCVKCNRYMSAKDVKICDECFDKEPEDVILTEATIDDFIGRPSEGDVLKGES